MDIAYYTDPGGRKVNEDALAVIEEDGSVLLILGDGVGSCDDGKFASDTLLSVVRADLAGELPDEDLLEDAVFHAGDLLCREEGSVCTTAAIVWIHGNRAVVGNVGDSRIYQFREEGIQYQSIDHSVAQLAVFAGELPADKIRQSPDKNRLICAVGSRKGRLRVDTEELSVQPGDAFLLCTDGFWNEVIEKEMLADARVSDSAADWLGRMRARILHPSDNHSAIAVRL